VAGGPLEKVGGHGCGAGGAVSSNRAVVDLLADLASDRRCDVGRLCGLVVHAAARPVAFKAVARVVVLLEAGGSKNAVCDPTVTAIMPLWCSTTEPAASSSQTTERHSTLWFTGCWKIWRSVLR
jgi:hypothetical protein